MLNPQQNININISYNLGQDKPSQQLPAKKLTKTVKAHKSQHHPNCDIEIKLKSKGGENNLRKSNEFKSTNESKKNKKKGGQPTRNTLTPDLFGDRRIKTEGPSADHDIFSAFKKDKTGAKHYKSINVPVGRSTQSCKKSNSQFKVPKVKQGHITSCPTPNMKKTNFELVEHTISQAIIPKKKRTHSHSTFIKNDKIVSKLLNVSILASQLGSSQPITSQRKANSSNQSRSFKEYMSSMDLRIIRCMQDDIPFFADKKESHPDIIRNILRYNDISLQELTRKAMLIQRKWRQKCKKGVITQYKMMFQQIAAKLKQQKKISDLSQIQNSFSQDEEQKRVSQLFSNNQLSSSIKKQAYYLGGDSMDSNSFEQLQKFRWIQQDDADSFNQTQKVNINFDKLRQRVDTLKSQSTRIPKPLARQKYKEHLVQWNSVGNACGDFMKSKGSIDEKVLFNYLAQQSIKNKDFIQHQFEREETEQLGTAKQHHQSTNNRQQFSQFSHQSSEFEMPAKDKERQERKHQDSFEEEDEEEGNQYDNAKYEPVQQIPPKEAHTPSEPFQMKQQNNPEPLDMQNGEIQDYRSVEQTWISQQIMDNNVVRNYLQSGLEDFGINFNSRIIQLPRQSRQENQQQNQYSQSDEAIGARFQQANFGVVRRTSEDQVHPQPASKAGLEDKMADNLVEQTVRFLISEFASDISIILKKSTNPPPPAERRPVARPQGIPTSFNSIKDYLSKFIAYIMRDDHIVQKVTDTINKDIGPTSLEILTYLRPEAQDSMGQGFDQQQPSIDEDQGLFVVPAQQYEQFENMLEQEYRTEHQKDMGPRMKAYLSFWHRCIFQSFNQCLDYERPYGIEGKPYQWTIDTKMFREIKKDELPKNLAKAENRLLDLTSMVGGIIFDKIDCPFAGSDLAEDQKHMMNEERLSRILATELLESEQSWINYNDQLAELLVELSRLIEQKLFFENGTQLKKLQRRRKLLIEQSRSQEAVVFNIEEL